MGPAFTAWKLSVGLPNLFWGDGTTSAKGWRKIPDSPSMVKDCAFAGGVRNNAARRSAKNGTHFAMVCPSVTFLSLSEIHWAGTRLLHGPAVEIC